MRGSIWVILVGVLFLLDSFDILSWSHSWPLFIVVAGLMALFQHTSFKSAAAVAYPYGVPPSSPVTPPPSPATTSTSIVPSSQHDQEGS
ncbi:LiaI-LiaF-like domain-containing protein [Tunturiibacter gelidiferens]|uniref:LiaI-LiaF-like domain-containing protein n=1 Tax=Tunturiibacter gelidiferens TaxID=3069689 RepID=UPI003D9AE26E